MGSGGSKKKKKGSTSFSVDPPSQSSASSASQSSANTNPMSLFRKQSNAAKKRLQHQQYLARESPEATIDYSKCEISEVPAGTYSLIKVLQKEALLLHDNWITSIKGGGSFKDLSCIRVLDLHNNEISSLPDEITELHYLQVLNIENNKLKHLPDGLGELTSLQTLNLKGNKLKDLSDSICKLRCLRTLDISQNHITHLPKQLCQVRTLETLVLDADKMIYPGKDICEEGTEAIAKYLCTENGLQYEPPSKFLLEVLEPPTPISASLSSNALKVDVSAINVSIMQYEHLKESKRQERIALELQLEEEQKLQAQLAAKAASNKQHLINYVAQDQKRLEGELSALQHQKDEERHRLVDALCQAERSAEDLFRQLQEMNENAKKTEELLEQMEQERMEAEQWFIVRQEEVEQLRRQDVIIAMEKVLEESAIFDNVVRKYLGEKEHLLRKAMESECATDGELEKFMEKQQQDKQDLVNKLMKEESLQREAFEALQLQKDAKHSRLTGQISLIEQELTQLTMLEVEQRELRFDAQQNMLAERRVTLAALLSQLMGERDSRVMELRKRLMEMEEQRENDQTDYWMVQYQRLMDKKPQAMIDMERRLEIAVVEILENAGAEEYFAQFARHRITIETLSQISEDDLKSMGVHQLGVRKAILTEIDRYKEREEEEHSAAVLKGITEQKKPQSKPITPTCPEEGAIGFLEPSAPPGSASLSPSTPSEIIARGINSECVVCMEVMSEVLFLNCGHVCCCNSCSDQVEECPLCRGAITARIKLTYPLLAPSAL